MSARAAKYQQQVTGRAVGRAVLVNGVKFDGAKGGVLLDAKGPGYRRLLFGEARRSVAAQLGMLKQARRQVAAAKGTPIEWVFADADVAKYVAEGLKNNRIVGITVRYEKPRF